MQISTARHNLSIVLIIALLGTLALSRPYIFDSVALSSAKRCSPQGNLKVDGWSGEVVKEMEVEHRAEYVAGVSSGWESKKKGNEEERELR